MKEPFAAQITMTQIVNIVDKTDDTVPLKDGVNAAMEFLNTSRHETPLPTTIKIIRIS